MADNTAIEWTDATWNPIRARHWEPEPGGGAKERIGWHCEHASEGCRFCYAEGFNKRLGTGREFKPGHLKHLTRHGDKRGDVTLFLDEKMLTQPLRWKRPRMIFVCSMTDLFADFVEDAWLDRMFAVMALCPQHVFQVLTKRPERMRKYLKFAGSTQLDRGGGEDRFSTRDGILLETIKLARSAKRMISPPEGEMAGRPEGGAVPPRFPVWPLPNVWLGVSCEDQENADERVPMLLDTPSAVRWVSAEPLLGPIDLLPYLFIYTLQDDAQLACKSCDEPLPFHDPATTPESDIATPRLDWIVAGGESGKGARPMHPGWARSLRDQCAEADVPFLFKQWGAWAPGDWAFNLDDHVCFLPDDPRVPVRGLGDQKRAQGRMIWSEDDKSPEGRGYLNVGKKRAGRLLDGVEHNGFPEAR